MYVFHCVSPIEELHSRVARLSTRLIQYVTETKKHTEWARTHALCVRGRRPYHCAKHAPDRVVWLTESCGYQCASRTHQSKVQSGARSTVACESQNSSAGDGSARAAARRRRGRERGQEDGALCGLPAAPPRTEA